MEAGVKTAYKWLPVTVDYCIGCGKCVEACPQGCLELVWEFATLQRAGDCVSAGDCVDVCPQNGIRMAWVKTTGSQDVGHWCATPEPALRPPGRWLGWLWPKRAAAD
jgi:NAD-dependent dihydropyrimidine dehydrogenase PreA subunit